MARSVMVTSLRNKPLRVKNNNETGEEMYNNLNARYERASAANKVYLLTSLINTHYQARKNMSDYTAEVEIHSNSPAILSLPVAEECK